MQPQDDAAGTAGIEPAAGDGGPRRLSRAVRYITRELRVPAWSFGLLAVSAFLGNAAQWVDRADLKAAADESKAEAECRSRIVGYVEGLSISSSISLGRALVDRVGPRDDAAFDIERQRFAASIERLAAAKKIREKATEVCANDPGYDPDQIPRR